MNEIYISNDLQRAKEELLSMYPNAIIFEDNELKLPMVNQIKDVSYKTHQSQQVIIIKALNFRNESQNALLKLLEDTPTNVKFIILTTSKYALLDTIKSRMSLHYLNYPQPSINIDLNPQRLTTKDIYDTLKKDLSKEELKAFITQLFKQISNPTSRVLDDFELAIQLVDLNADKAALLSLCLLCIRNANK
ncbi:MAG: hypothetical protein GXO40_05615 [Epsilonproteobacteria bacterium]|nr:hypothetical protein [Campylobacterota bacterium]